MILGLIADLAVAVQQVPQTVQCVTPVPDPWWKWLLPTLVQTTVSLISIFAGVGIAVWSFGTNKKEEHERWVRDQKKAEWRGLLDALNSVYLPMAVAKESGKPLPAEDSQKLMELSQAFKDRIFIAGAAIDELARRLYKCALEYLAESDDARDRSVQETALRQLKELTKEVREAAKRDLKTND